MGVESREHEPKFAVRRATPDDAPEIARIQRASWIATYPNEAAGITVADIEAHMGDQQARVERRRTELEGEQRHERRRTFIAEHGGKVVAYCGVRRMDVENHVDSLYADPEYRGKGAGGQVFREALAWLGVEVPVGLEVVAYNIDAIAFYEHFGFHDASAAGDQRVGNKRMPMRHMRREPDGEERTEKISVSLG